jgi:transposase-like protein
VGTGSDSAGEGGASGGIDAEGGKVSLVVRRHNISENLLYDWRSARTAAALAMGAPENVEFIPAGITGGPFSRMVPAVVPAAAERV